MRHTTAMESVESGVDVIYISDLSVKTTEVYARADAMHERQAIEATSKEITAPEEAEWVMIQPSKTGLRVLNADDYVKNKTLRLLYLRYL